MIQEHLAVQVAKKGYYHNRPKSGELSPIAGFRRTHVKGLWCCKVNPAPRRSA